MSINKTLALTLSILLTFAIGLGTGFAQSATTPPATPGTTPPTPAPGVAPNTPPTPAPGVSPSGPPTPEPGSKDRAQINNFLINHPQVADELHKDPNLINNPQWLSKHPEVGQWMSTHPNAQRLASEHPDWAVKQAETSAMSDARHGVKTTDEFLSKHPGVANELAKNPGLIDNKEYLAQHPALQGYLSSHPEIRNEWQSHPEAFAHTAEGYAARHDQIPQHTRPQQAKAATRPPMK